VLGWIKEGNCSKCNGREGSAERGRELLRQDVNAGAECSNKARQGSAEAAGSRFRKKRRDAGKWASGCKADREKERYWGRKG